VRHREQNGSISVRAIAGTHVVLLGIDMEEAASRRVLSFAPAESADPTSLTSVDRPSDGAGWSSLPAAVHDLTGLIEEGRGFRLLGWSLLPGVESLACDLSVGIRQRTDVPTNSLEA
jgi:hypothetical protein